MKRGGRLRRRAWRPREGKFGVAPKEERQWRGHLFHSRAEKEYARRLELMRQAVLPDRDRPVAWKLQQSIKLEVNGKLICRYIVDFVVHFADGHEEYHEVKGFETETWKIKEKLFRAIHPEWQLKIIRV